MDETRRQPNTETTQPGMVRLARLADVLPVHPRTLERRARAGDIPGACRFGGLWLVPRSLFEKYQRGELA